MALIKCPECGKEVSDKAVACPNCGFPIQQYVEDNLNTSLEENDQYKGTEYIKKDRSEYNEPIQVYPDNDQYSKYNEGRARKNKRNGVIFIAIIVGVFAFMMILPMIYKTRQNTANEDLTEEEIPIETYEEETAGAIVSEVDWIEYYQERGIEPIPYDADILYQYGDYLIGETVYTAFIVKDATKTQLKADTESNDSFFFSILCNFEDSSEIEGVDEGDTVVIIGTVDSASHTVVLNDCHLMLMADEAQELIELLSENAQIEIDYALEKKNQIEAEQAEENAADKQAYIDSCESVNYNDVARNPDDYDGKLIKVSGKVIQVSEGLFNSVTLRVQQSDGNVWYVTYMRKDGESRVLEGDSVLIYGKCKGVTSYTNVAGSRVTIPSINAEYID